MKAVYKFLFLFLLLNVFSVAKLHANGCTGSWFNIQYSPWCGCWQVCGNYISDCDELVSVTWNFGDGTPSVTGGSPCHPYTQPGTYTVTMTIVAYCHTFFNLFTTTCPITRQVVVTSTGPILIAGFSSDTSCLGFNTHFTNTTISPAGSNNTYTWNFGDGTTGTGANPNHTFDSCGAYDVTMIVTNSAPCCSMTGRDTITHRVYVNCNPFDESNNLGDADPYIQESGGVINTVSGACAGDTTRFSLSTNGPIANVLWTFPDSSTSTSLTPWYIYPACPPAIPYTYVHLTTNHGCTGIIDSVTGIFCPSNIALSSTTTLCSGQCSGTATVNMSGGGTPPFSMIWNDPASQTTQTATSLCAGPYNVTVTDGNGCHATPAQPVTVNDFPFPFVGTPTIQGNVRCFGWAGGSAVLNYTGGTPPYSTYWDNGATTAAVTGLIGGPHTVTGTDAHGCVFTTVINISQPPPIAATITLVNAGCNLCNGSATVNPSGGNGTYVYRWLTAPNQTTQTATNLCAGVYQVIVEDGAVSGCNDTFSVAISENGSQPVTATSTNATCSNICNGTALATPTGGCLNPPCSYSWLDSAGTPIGQNTQNASNLCSGNYRVQVTNGTGCTSFANATVIVPNPIIPSATASPNTCGGSCNGSITASGSGGNPPYAYQWYDNANNPIAGQTSAVTNNRCAGNYSVRLTDQQGCIVSATATVLSNPLVSNATATSVLCNGDCNGMISMATSGGSTPYAYVVKNAGGTTVYSGSSAIIANLCAGNYNVIVNDAGSCSLTIPVTISQPSVVNPVPSTVMPACFGNCNGTISVAVNGGTAPYTYEWRSNSTLIGTNTSVSNRCAGAYTVKVFDANNCVTPFIPVVLNQPARLSDTMLIIDPYCTGGQGSIDLTVAGGTSPYSYSWNNGAYTTQDLSGLSSGTYTVIVTDAHSCTLTDAATFTQLPPLAETITAHLYNGYHFKCAGGADGEVVARVTGGLPPYSYQWNDSLNSTVDSIYGLTAGTYTLTVTDSHGCVRVDSVALNLIPPPFFANETVQDVSCPGANDGSVTVTPSGGVLPYVFYWQHDTAHFNLQLTNVDSGRYIVNLFDANRCLIIDTVFVNEPPPILASYVVTPPNCFNGTDGSIDLTVTGGTLPIIYSWNNGAYNTEDISGLAAGPYTVSMVDARGCSHLDTALVTQPAGMLTNLAVVNVSCFQGADGAITLTVSNGALPYSYSWNNGQYITKDIQSLTAGHYVVVISDGNSCTISDSADVTQPPLITDAKQVSICANDSLFVGGAYQTTPGVYVDTVPGIVGCDTVRSTTLSFTNPVIGNRNISMCDKDSFFVGGAYQTIAGLYYDTLVASSGCDSVLATNLAVVNQYTTQFAQTICYGQRFLYHGNYYAASGTYTDTLSSSGGCDSVVTFTLNVLQDIGLYASPDKASLLVGESLTVHIYNTSAADIVSYTWSPNVGITCADTLCSSAVLGPQVDTRYTIVAVDSNGCRDTVLIPILVSGPVIFIPNVFTPNGDGANDVFEIYGNKDALRFVEVKIFNRWGEKVFESNDLNFKWDGTWKGQTLNPSVFVYTLRVLFSNSKTPEKLYKGSVTLMR
jgi:gliding motility-associated-like protein